MTLIKELGKLIGLFVVAFLLHNFLFYFGEEDFFRMLVCIVVAIISIYIGKEIAMDKWLFDDSIFLGITYGWLFVIMPVLLTGRCVLEWLDTI